MKKIIVGLVVVLVMLYATALALPLNPEEQRPGTRLSGERVEDLNPDSSFLEPRTKIHVQTNTWYLVPHSVTTVSFVADNKLYVPCGWCATKRWPKNVAADPNVTVRVGNKLYDRRAVVIPQEDERRRILNIPSGEPTPDVTLYRMDPPTD
jgi:hypothetical protein